MLFFFPLLSAVAHDGDTFRIELDLGFRMRTSVHLRVLGLDTPELRGATILEREAAEVACRCAQHWVDTEKPEWCSVTSEDKYGGRWLGNLHHLHPLIELEHEDSRRQNYMLWASSRQVGRRYDGRAKPEWSIQELQNVLKAGAEILGGK